MALIVQKFGGSSVADRDRIFNVARIVANTHAAGNDVVVVVSAQGDTTDDLHRQGGRDHPRPVPARDGYAAGRRRADQHLAAGHGAGRELGCPRHQPDWAGRRASITDRDLHARAHQKPGHRAHRERACQKPASWWWRASRASTATTTSPPWDAAAPTPAPWPLRPRCTRTCARFTRTWTAFTPRTRAWCRARAKAG